MRGRKVSKIYNKFEVPGLVSKSKSHKTKTLVGVYNVAQAGLSTDEGFPWGVVCELHSSFAGFTTLPLAKAAVSHPDSFCDTCALDLASPTGQTEVTEEVVDSEPVAAVG